MIHDRPSRSPDQAIISLTSSEQGYRGRGIASEALSLMLVPVYTSAIAQLIIYALYISGSTTSHLPHHCHSPRHTPPHNSSQPTATRSSSASERATLRLSSSSSLSVSVGSKSFRRLTKWKCGSAGSRAAMGAMGKVRYCRQRRWSS